VNLDVAAALRESRGQWLLPDVFAQRVGLDAAGLRAAVRDLRDRGFRIEVRPGGEMSLAAAPDALDVDQITHRLDRRVIGRQVTVYAETSSTNDLAWERLTAGAPEGECFFAEHQTHGRGRQGRRWIAPPGSAILMSVDVRLSPFPGPALTFAASVATAEAITESTGLSCAIEWPNDITCRDRKAAGILVEGRRLRPTAPAFVVGVGINANVPLAQLPEEVRRTATSLGEECGRPVDRVLLARHLIAALDRWYAVLVGGDLARVHERWLELSATVGRRLCVAQHGRRFEGVVVDVSPTEGLALRLDHGEVHLLQACLLYTSPSPRDATLSRMPSSA